MLFGWSSYAGCQFSTWVRPGKRTPPSVKFPGKKLVFGGLGGVRFIHFEGAEQNDGKLPAQDASPEH